jgi:hypothetical protein
MSDRPSQTSICSDQPALPASRLERLIGKGADSWTVDDLIDVVHDQGIRLVSLMHVGGDSRLKTVDFAPRDQHHLRDVLLASERADGSSPSGTFRCMLWASDDSKFA